MKNMEYEFSCGAWLVVIREKQTLPYIDTAGYYKSCELRELAAVCLKLADKMDKNPPYGK